MNTWHRRVHLLLNGREMTLVQRSLAMQKSSRNVPIAGIVFLAAGVLACSGSDGLTPSSTNPSGGSPSGSTSSSTGTLAIHLTDSPFSDAKALLVTFSDVGVHRAEPGEWLTLPLAAGSSRTCDLKKLNGATDVLGVGSLPVGTYTQVRLNVSSVGIYFDAPSVGPACAPQIAPPAGLNVAVDIPSGEVKLNHEFTVTASATTMLLDFDGDQSIHQTGNGNKNGKFMMSPVIRVVSVQ
jgi:hypothetical protein